MEKNNYTKEEVLQLMYQAFESGFKKYEVVDAGLESMETKEECGWILRRYDSDLEKETQKQLITEIMNEDAKDGLYKKQTAVEWLLATLEQNSIIDLDWVDSDKYYTIIEQAKEMEKQQIMKAVYDAMGTNFDPNMGRAEQYYNKQYGGNNEQQ